MNLAYTLRMMGAKVAIFDADVFGPSLPTMTSPKNAVLEMDKETGTITPTEYEGVGVVSFGFAGQGSAIMRGPMVSGLINQMLTTTNWGDLDYLIIDMPLGAGDVQLTICQVVPISAAVVVTTPQKLAFIDVEKGVRMFAKLSVPCVAVVENMSYFEVDGVKHMPFGEGSGKRICDEYGVPNLFRMPIVPELSACGDSGVPLVLADPAGEVSARYGAIAAKVVQEVAKLGKARVNAVEADAEGRAGVAGAVRVPLASEGGPRPSWAPTFAGATGARATRGRRKRRSFSWTGGRPCRTIWRRWRRTSWGTTPCRSRAGRVLAGGHARADSRSTESRSGTSDRSRGTRRDDPHWGTHLTICDTSHVTKRPPHHPLASPPHRQHHLRRLARRARSLARVHLGLDLAARRRRSPRPRASRRRVRVRLTRRPFAPAPPPRARTPP